MAWLRDQLVGKIGRFELNSDRSQRWTYDAFLELQLSCGYKATLMQDPILHKTCCCGAGARGSGAGVNPMH
eukprot:9692289-Ditylum_brightwellii.AAC.1